MLVEASQGCDICATTGQCYQAFKSSPGMFCGAFSNFQTNNGQQSNCCCPVGSYCKVSQFDCRCHIPKNVPNSNPYNANNYNDSYGQNQYNDYFPFEIIPIFIILCCFIACCCHSCSKSRDRESDMSKIPFATAVPAYNPEWSGYGSMNDRGSGGGGNAANMTGAALGGLGIGTLIGNVMDSWKHHSPSHHEADRFFVADEGGYDIPGDMGGGNDGVDIQGDF